MQPGQPRTPDQRYVQFVPRHQPTAIQARQVTMTDHQRHLASTQVRLARDLHDGEQWIGDQIRLAFRTRVSRLNCVARSGLGRHRHNFRVTIFSTNSRAAFGRRPAARGSLRSPCSPTNTRARLAREGLTTGSRGAGQRQQRAPRGSEVARRASRSSSRSWRRRLPGRTTDTGCVLPSRAGTIGNGKDGHESRSRGAQRRSGAPEVSRSFP